MHRDLGRLTTTHFDLVIIGGGIYGACAAWEATLRGLSVALLEQGDFGCATSANSAKIIHGGFRYLQHADLKRMRESIHERRTFMRIAPHLVRPVPFIFPTYGRGIEGRQAMRAALALYDFVAWDRNVGVQDPDRQIPAGRIISREECLRMGPGLAEEGLTGGAVWHDGQFYNPDRLTLAFMRSAAEQGACTANYARVTGLLQAGGRVKGLRAMDVLSGRFFEVRAALVLNASGPWVTQLLRGVPGRRAEWQIPLAKAINVITPSLTNGHGLSVRLPHQDGDAAHQSGCCRRIHLTPWRGRTIVGSLYVPFEETARFCHATAAEVARFIGELNRAYPGRPISPEDVVLTHAGLLPLEANRRNAYDLTREYDICDHQRSEGIEGLISVVGVKYTTARDVAQKAVAAAIGKLGKTAGPSRSASTPVYGGAIGRFEPFLAEARQRRLQGIDEGVIEQLVRNHGSEYLKVLRYAEERPALARRLDRLHAVIAAEAVHAVREEQAVSLADVVLRRTELGTLGHPGRQALVACAQVMADELGWDATRMEREIDQVEEVFTSWQGHRAESVGAK